MWFFRVLSSITFLFSIILSIPIAFDVGGRECGLAYSLSLFYFYFGVSILKLATPERSRLRWSLGLLVSWSQWIILPSLLIWSMNRYAVDASSSGDWVAKTFDLKRAPGQQVSAWIFGHGGLMEMFTIRTWDILLRYSTPLFQLAEGFCSLLVIQAAGQITRWLVNRGRSDAWMVSCSPCLFGRGANLIRLGCSCCLPQSSQARSIFSGGSRLFLRLTMSTLFSLALPSHAPSSSAPGASGVVEGIRSRVHCYLPMWCSASTRSLPTISQPHPKRQLPLPPSPIFHHFLPSSWHPIRL